MPQQFEFPKSPIKLNFNPRTVYLVLGILGILWVLSGIYTVDPDENAVILRFGKLQEVVDPGLHYHWPAPIEMALVRSVTRVYREEIGFQTIDPGPPAKYRRRPKEALMLTGDENIVNVEMVVQYRVGNPKNFVFNVEDPEGVLHSTGEVALRSIVGRTALNSILTVGRGKVEADTRLFMETLLDAYGTGITITEVKLQAVDPPDQVKDAFQNLFCFFMLA